MGHPARNGIRKGNVMSVVQPGGNKRPGGKPASGSKPGQSPRQGQRPPSGRRPAEKPGSGGTGRGAPQGRGRPAARPGRGPAPAGPPRRFSPATLAYGTAGLVVVVVVVLILVLVLGGGSKTPGPGPAVTPVPPSVLQAVTGVSQSQANTVGVPSGLNAPKTASGQPALSSGGKPEALYIGAEFCPYCGAERWALVMAFSRFGTFSGLQETTSSPYDSPPAVATFTFAKAHYTSNLVDFTMVENESNDTTGLGTRHVLQPLTSAQQHLWTKYSAQFGLQSTGFPFVDFGNKVFVLGPTYNPQVLLGLDQGQIAQKLSNPADPVTQAVVGAANYMTAAICDLTGNQPASVCSASGTTAAAKQIGLS